MQVHTERRDQEPTSKARRRGHHRAARATALDPRAEHRRRQTEAAEREVEHPDRRRLFPIAGGGVVNAKAAREWDAEHRQRIGLADRQMDSERGRGHEPTAIARRRHRARPIEECKHERRLSAAAIALATAPRQPHQEPRLPHATPVAVHQRAQRRCSRHDLARLAGELHRCGPRTRNRTVARRREPDPRYQAAHAHRGAEIGRAVDLEMGNAAEAQIDDLAADPSAASPPAIVGVGAASMAAQRGALTTTGRTRPRRSPFVTSVAGSQLPSGLSCRASCRRHW